MSYAPEPDFPEGMRPEEIFHKAILKEIDALLKHNQQAGLVVRFFILEKFGLDLAVFLELLGGKQTVKFLELKAFVGSRQGGVGLGNPKGQGSQVDLLLLGDSELMLADVFSRWILVDGTKPLGSTRFVIFSNQEARNAAMGGVRKGKQNNLRISALQPNAITWDSLCSTLDAFLTS